METNPDVKYICNSLIICFVVLLFATFVAKRGEGQVQPCVWPNHCYTTK